MFTQIREAVPFDRILPAALALLVLLSGATAVGSAAGTAGVSVTPADGSVAVGETTTFDVVLDGTDGGVQSAELSVALEDPSVASIVDASVQGTPGFTYVDVAADGSSVDVAYTAADTADTGSVAFLTVTVEGEAAGTTGVSVRPRGSKDAVVVYDEAGSGYDLSSVGGAALTVEASDDGTGDGSDGGADDGSDDGDDGDDETAAETVTATLSPASGSVASGETTTFDVVVDSEDVGAVDLTLSLTNGSVATIESVDTPANDGSESVSNDGQTATAEAFGLQNAGANGEITVATVTVRGASAGSTTLTLDSARVANVQGTLYATTVGGDASITVQRPADLRVTDLSVDSASVTRGDSVTLTATVENLGGVAGTESVAFTVDGQAVGSETVTLGPGETTTVAVQVDSTGYALGVHDAAATVADTEASAQFTVAFPALSDELAPPTNLDGDAVLEDVNGDGVFDAGDATALFANRDSALVQENPAQFDFNGDGSVDVFDVQAAFYQAVLAD